MRASTLISSLFVLREGSVVAHFWLVMSVPVSHVGTVTLEKVTESLEKGLRRYSGSIEEDVARFNGYIIHVPTLFVSGEYGIEKIEPL